MFKKAIRVLFKIFAVIFILISLLVVFVRTYAYIDDWKKEQELLKNPEYAPEIKKMFAFKEELISKNDRIVRVDIYNTNYEYILEKHSKSIDKYKLAGVIKDDNQIKAFKKIFKKTISSKINLLREVSGLSDIWINVIYDDGTNAVGEVLSGKNGILRIFSYKTNEIPDGKGYCLSFNMPIKLSEMIDSNRK